jgi:hypothetical protein
MKATTRAKFILIVVVVTVGCQKQQAQRPCAAVDPEAAVFAELRADIVNRYERRLAKDHRLDNPTPPQSADPMKRKMQSIVDSATDMANSTDLGILEMLDSEEIGHIKVWRNNLEHPDKPMGDESLVIRKRLFGR